MTFADYSKSHMFIFIDGVPALYPHRTIDPPPPPPHPVLRGRDPSAVAVLVEDSAAVVGVFLAGSAIALTHFTGNVIYDAIGSISIGGRCA